MNPSRLFSSVLIGLIIISLVACNAAAEPQAQTPPQPRPTREAPIAEPDIEPSADFSLGVSGIGEVKAARDASLVFSVVGTVNEVLVEEGDRVEQDQVLAVLDLRIFEQQIQQAQASIKSAQAQRNALFESPRSAEVVAAQAQIAQAQASLARVQAGAEEEDLRSAQSAVTAAEVQLQSTRDQLSLAKTNAEAQVVQASESLVQAQAAYAVAKSNWEFVQDTGQNPQQPVLGVDPQGNEIENDVVNAQRESIYAQFVQAEASLRQAEEAVDQAIIAAEEARKAELVGIEGAEQQVVQSQAQLDKLLGGAEPDEIAGAQSALAQAVAGRDRLNPNPDQSQIELADAGIVQAEASLRLAEINLEEAELRAPFDGIVSEVNIDPGDPSSVATGAAIAVVDVEKLHVDVQISDVDIANVIEGQIAEVRAEAVDEVFPGEVSYIAPTASVQGNIRTYLVRIALDEQAGLRPGMSVRVVLLTD
ncbi:MAG: Multidrug efflux pump subunit AcrA (membrane-fusion protein) [Chloroflexi bacterium AL-W]|nr:Multidrug efflux pump subunit AcrA (membrane-fusion protein) [Chloroflexi bacterium AL-N1]NOK68535.1 Multidrug efflux pump subunit AcrA (membrane-fusion protein) [Chloroflexi bacterium AL-N10]NOK76021.1 Multidrug efflux pump subunit AcrA (membrane-fusion protein) [Chloroflexi bacterium AL-N5]NOK82492.1 Multidrug efflux pump subunit AcrA (membrane-fusion protein) [Chloroflexi bacterium AL-W]NOK92804.1 Multidrug efflux pump subunit AcrA (membrane-fusion protein) [Chloroflexi bacterium AL-N15]